MSKRREHRRAAVFQRVRVVERIVQAAALLTLKALNYLIHQLESDIVTIDYRVRGFTRDINGNKENPNIRQQDVIVCPSISIPRL